MGDILMARKGAVGSHALVWELRKTNLTIHQQAPMPVLYEGQVIGEYVADLIVDEKVVVELKAASSIATAHRLQVLNYLRASDLRIGLILNFGNPRLEIARVVNRF